MLLDTSYLIDLMKGDEAAVEKATELETKLIQQHLSAMTLFELYYGVARAIRSTDERAHIEEILGSKPIYPADATVMRKAGSLAGALANEGRPIGDGDVIIGATARMIEEPVLTRNVGDFERIDGIEVESY